MKLYSLLLALSALTRSCTNKTNDTELTTTTVQPASNYNTTYNTLRCQALTITPEQLGLNLPKDSLTVYGVIMDWRIGKEIATLTAYKSGDASLYISSGGSVIGGGQYKNVDKASKKLIAMANDFTTNSPVEKMPMPEKDNIAFYLLTNKGVYSNHEKMSKIEDGSSPLLPLFEEVNIVLDELRSVSEN